ncbi:MAG: tetratricopeptide repeat protein [Gammaproteobacteria bacterium]
MTIKANLEAMLAAGQDSAMLRYTLGNAYLKDGDLAAALAHLHAAVELDPGYSAAWKSYAKALTESGAVASAIHAYETGIEVAESKGDMQAAKEMRVFLKRLKKAT